MNRSSWRSVERMRTVFDSWFDRYPANAADPEREHQDLRARFRSRDHKNHHGAFFELFIHELLVKLDCGVFVHPDVPGTSARPDFRVAPPVGSPFYLEATMVVGTSEEDDAATARKAVVHDAINKLETNNFFLMMKERGSPRTPPKASKIREFLQEKLDALDPDEVNELWQSGEESSVPEWEFEHDGWAISFQPIPRKPEARTRRTEQPIGTVFGEAHWEEGPGASKEGSAREG